MILDNHTINTTTTTMIPIIMQSKRSKRVPEGPVVLVGSLIIAAKGTEKKLKKLGFKIAMPPLVAYVGGKMNEMGLKEGEMEKAKKHAEDLANELHQ